MINLELRRHAGEARITPNVFHDASVERVQAHVLAYGQARPVSGDELARVKRGESSAPRRPKTAYDDE